MWLHETGGVDPVKTIENSGKILLGNAAPGIADADFS